MDRVSHSRGLKTPKWVPNNREMRIRNMMVVRGKRGRGSLNEEQTIKGFIFCFSCDLNIPSSDTIYTDVFLKKAV